MGTVTLSPTFQIVIPKEIREKLGSIQELAARSLGYDIESNTEGMVVVDL